MIEIRTFKAEEWPAYRDVRLAALKDSPDAFGSTWEVSKTYADADWCNRLANIDPTLDCPLGAFNDGSVVGLAWGNIQQDTKTRADLYQMWMAPESRGQGAARRLLDAVIHWAREQAVIELMLGVTVGNTAAESLYRSAGFEPFGELEQLRPGADKWITNMRLVLAAD